MNAECKLLRLEQLVCGELEGNELLEVRRHIESCSDCATFIAELESGRTAFLQAHPFSSFSRAHAPPVPIPWYTTFVQKLRQPVLLPAYGALLLALTVLPIVVINHLQHPDVMFKGTVPLTCMVRRDNQIRPVADMSSFRAGDQIQMMFSLDKLRYVSLISIDSRGTISFYDPDGQSDICSVPAGPGVSVVFPGSIVLDNTPGAELAVVLFSNGALARDSVKAWAKQQFNACRDVANLQQKLLAVKGEFGAEVATVLLPKEGL